MPTYEEYITKSILSSNQYQGNSKVLNLEQLAFTEYTIENLDILKWILRTAELEKLATLPPPKDLLGAELYVVRFSDERDKWYYGIYYDSIELYQDPEIIEIFPAEETSKIFNQ